MRTETCPVCDGDGFTEEWNRDQTGVIQELCRACVGAGKVTRTQLENLQNRLQNEQNEYDNADF